MIGAVSTGLQISSPRELHPQAKAERLPGKPVPVAAEWGVVLVPAQQSNLFSGT